MICLFFIEHSPILKILLLNNLTLLMTEKISGPQAVSSAWKVFKKNWKFLVPALIATIAIMFVLQFLQTTVEGKRILALVVSVIAIIVGIMITLGWSKIVLKLVHNHETVWQDFKTDTKTWLSFFLARLLIGIFMFAAIIIFAFPISWAIGSIVAGLILPAILSIILSLSGIILIIWLSVRYMFISFIAVEKKLNAWKMLSESSQLAKGHIIQLFIFWLLLILVNVIGALLVFVGLLVSVPVSMIATGYVYEHLKKKHQSV